jgi:hypothetical protein
MARSFLGLQISVAVAVILFAPGTASKTYADQYSIEKRFDKFDRLQNQFFQGDPSTQKVARVFGETYKKLFSSLQTRTNIAKLDSADVGLLFRAAVLAQFYTDDSTYVRDMQLDLNELQKRGLASQTQYHELYDALIESRMFSDARALAHTHPLDSLERLNSPHGVVFRRVTMARVPEFLDESDGGTTGPTDMVLSSDGGKLVRHHASIHAPAQIVVIISPECHFAKGGIGDIETDPALSRVFQNEALWLVPPMGSPGFDSIAQWNRKHPRQIMNLAYKIQEWPMFDRWETPTFYFLKYGKVVAEVVGWSGQRSMTEIRTALRQVGLL